MGLESIISSQLQGMAVTKLAAKFGLDEKTAAAIAAIAVPVLLKALQRNSSAGGAQQLFNALQSDHSGSILNDVLGAVTGDVAQQDGTKILGHLFGQQTDGIVGALGKAAGIDASAAGGMLASIAPIVMGALGQHQQSNDLNADGVAQTLADEDLSSQGGLVEAAEQVLGGQPGSLDSLIKLGSSFFSK